MPECSALPPSMMGPAISRLSALAPAVATLLSPR